MNKLTLLFGALICLVAVNARHYADRSDDESLDSEEPLRRKDHSVSRHRRRRWQANYGYDYPAPSYYYPDRRDSDRNQEVIQNIYRLLEDIAAHLRRTPPPPPPPQPIFIPYPVPYPVSTGVTCKTPDMSNPNVNITQRFPAMEDTNQNWGFVAPPEDTDDGSDGARPISFEPLVPKQYMSRPAPQVEHGSQQAAFSTDAPKFQNAPSAFAAQSLSSSSSVPGMCNAAVLSCCGFSGDKAQQRQCFANVGCSMSFNDGNSCTPDSIKRALDSFKQAYSPVQ